MYAGVSRPGSKPTNPNFSSGPCRKRPGWSLQALEGAALGRSHRSKEGKAKLKEIIDLTREVLGIPDDYRIAIAPDSDTGAVEMALWGLLGPRGVEPGLSGATWRIVGRLAGRSSARHRVYVEWIVFGRSGAQRRLYRGRSPWLSFALDWLSWCYYDLRKEMRA